MTGTTPIDDTEQLCHEEKETDIIDMSLEDYAQQEE